MKTAGVHHAARRCGGGVADGGAGAAAERMRRVGVLDTIAHNDPEASVRPRCVRQGRKELGWVIGRNGRINTRWTEVTRAQPQLAVEWWRPVPMSSSPLESGPPALVDVTSTLPIVFANVPDPVGAGFVTSLARPGGNATGFASYEFGFPASGEELLKEIAPGVTRGLRRAIPSPPRSPSSPLFRPSHRPCGVVACCRSNLRTGGGTSNGRRLPRRPLPPSPKRRNDRDLGAHWRLFIGR